MEKYDKTIALDFDGVIHGYSDGWKDGEIYDKPVDGVSDAIKQLQEDYKIVIYTTREDKEAIKKYLKEECDIDSDDIEISDSKPLAEVYVDDRAITFDGDWQKTLKQIDDFKPYIEKKAIRVTANNQEYFKQWISPTGQVYTFDGWEYTHIEYVRENPDKFGLTKEDLPYNFDDDSDDAIEDLLITNGWIRVGEAYETQEFYITAQLYSNNGFERAQNILLDNINRLRTNEIRVNNYVFAFKDFAENNYNLQKTINQIKRISAIKKTSRAVRQDMSLPVLRRLISLGYDKAIFNINEQTHTIFDICDHLNSEIIDLQKLVSNLEHEAPIFELSHIGCNCRLSCYSTTNSELDIVIIDSYGGFAESTKLDKEDKKNRQQVFYQKYNEYRNKFEEILNNRFIAGDYSDPMNGIYSFDYQLYTTDENNYYYQQPNHMQELNDRILDIILNTAQRYSIGIEEAQPSAMNYIVTTTLDLSDYDWSKEDFIDLEWTLTERLKYLNELVYELNQLEQWLLTTNERINDLLLQIETNQNVYQNNKQQQQQQQQNNNNQYDVDIDTFDGNF